jgi:hypothetical protein
MLSPLVVLLSLTTMMILVLSPDRKSGAHNLSRAGGSPRLKISSVNEVDCRGSRRATMNQTQHQRWAYRSAGLQALIENQQYTIKNAGSSCAVEATAWSGLSGESSIAREREELVFGKTVLAAHIEYKEDNFFLYSAGARTSFCLYTHDEKGRRTTAAKRCQ